MHEGVQNSGYRMKWSSPGPSTSTAAAAAAPQQIRSQLSAILCLIRCTPETVSCLFLAHPFIELSLTSGKTYRDVRLRTVRSPSLFLLFFVLFSNPWRPCYILFLLQFPQLLVFSAMSVSVHFYPSPARDFVSLYLILFPAFLKIEVEQS